MIVFRVKNSTIEKGTTIIFTGNITWEKTRR